MCIRDRVYVEDLNENGSKTILFLHGWPGDHNLFEYQFDYFSKMEMCIRDSIRNMEEFYS